MGQAVTANMAYPFLWPRNAVTSTLYYYRSRFYDSASNRFLSEDTLGLALNLYRFENNNPLRFTDPFGLAPGDSYPTSDAAGIQAIKDINGKSISDNLEYAGRIYKKLMGLILIRLREKGVPRVPVRGRCPPARPMGAIIIPTARTTRLTTTRIFRTQTKTAMKREPARLPRHTQRGYQEISAERDSARRHSLDLGSTK